MGIRLHWLRYKNTFAYCCFRIQIKWDIVRLKCSISAARRMLCQTFANNFWLSLKSFILWNLPWTSDCKVIFVSIPQKCAMRMFSFNFFIRSSVRLVLTITQWAKDVYINDKSTLRLVSPHCCTVLYPAQGPLNKLLLLSLRVAPSRFTACPLGNFSTRHRF